MSICASGLRESEHQDIIAHQKQVRRLSSRAQRQDGSNYATAQSEQLQNGNRSSALHFTTEFDPPNSKVLQTNHKALCHELRASWSIPTLTACILQHIPRFTCRVPSENEWSDPSQGVALPKASKNCNKLTGVEEI